MSRLSPYKIGSVAPHTNLRSENRLPTVDRVLFSGVSSSQFAQDWRRVELNFMTELQVFCFGSKETDLLKLAIASMIYTYTFDERAATFLTQIAPAFSERIQ